MLAESTRLSRPAVREALSGMGAILAPQLGADSKAGAIGMLAQQAYQQASTMTYGDMYFLLSISTALTVLLVPLIRKPQQSVEGMGH